MTPSDAPTQSRRDTPTVVVTGLLFLLSGAAALVYQVAWQRLLALLSGVGLYSVAMIVAAFMAGLGLGSQLGGRWSTRLGAPQALRAFAALELLIGAFGAASSYLFYDWLYPRTLALPSPSLQAALLHLGCLLPPTCLMGMSLPFLVRAVVRDVRGAGRRIGWLYGVNTLGAALGALATPWLLLPQLGIRGALFAAASANAAVGVGALLLSRLELREEPGVREQVAGSAPPAPAGATGRAPGLWLALYALSGFLALSLEMVWFRLVDVAVKSTAFTFGTVLAVYLFGSAAGALAGAALVERIRRPLAVFLLLQCAILVLAALPVAVVVALPARTPALVWFVRYWRDYAFFSFGHVADAASILHLYVALPVVLFLLPTLLMGGSFPVLQRAVQDDPATSGRKVGALQAANIAGCTLGSLLVGLVTLAALGTPGTLRLLLGLGFVFVAVGLRREGRLFVVPALVLALAVAAVPGPERLWRRLHGLAARDGLALFEEDATGVVAVTPDRGDWRLSVNGKGNSRIPYGDGHTVLGAVPALVHPAPRDVAVVGLGSGDTAWAASCRAETLATTVFEISSPQPRILWRLVGLADLPDTRRFLQDPRVRVVIEDGRKAIAARSTAYDMIEADAIWPETSGSGNLYSFEFFRLAAAHLKPGGIMCTWAPSERIEATFAQVFPYVLGNREAEILVGSREPLPIEPAVWRERAGRAAEYLGDARLREVLAVLLALRPVARRPDVRLNRDLFPRDEYASP